MPLVVKDRVKEVTQSGHSGTNSFVMNGAPNGFQTFASALADGDLTYYCCEFGSDFEVGIGTWDEGNTTLARTTILESTNSDSAVSFASGAKTVFITLPADKAIYSDNSAEGIKVNWVKTATANQTVFDGNDNNSVALNIDSTGLTDVYLNGVKLVETTDYTISTANNRITLGSGASVNDILHAVVFGNFVGQSGASVSITGGNVDGTAIGASTASTGAFTTVTASGGTLTNVTANTQSASDNSTKVATTEYADRAVSNLVDSAPASLNTLNELASALNDDASFSSTITTSIATKMPLAGGTFTGDVGIGVSPTKTLDVKSTTNDDHANIKITYGGTDGYRSGVIVANTHTGGREWGLYAGNDSTGTLENSFGIMDNTASAYRLVIKSSGNIGINDTTPNEGKLVVRGDAGSNALFVGGNSTSGNSWGLGVNAGSTSGDASFRVYDKDGSNSYLYVRGDGNVGVGASSPDQKMHVFQASSASAGIIPLIKVQTDTNNNSGDGSGIEFHGKYLGGEWGFGKIGGANSGANYGGALEFHTNTGNGSSVSTTFTKKMTLDHNGNLAIKKDATAIDTRIHIDNSPDGKWLTLEQAGRKHAFGTYFSSGSTLSRWDFYLSDGNTNGGNNVKMKILSSGNVEIPDGDLVIGTSGHGIDFSATSDGSGSTTSELLDDFETGSWTPFFYDSGNVSGGYATQFGTYTKIGRQVFANFKIENTTMSGSSLLRLGNLPFAMSSTVNGGGAMPVVADGFDSVALESYQGSNNQVFYDIKNGGYLTHSTAQSKKIQGTIIYIA